MRAYEAKEEQNIRRDCWEPNTYVYKKDGNWLIVQDLRRAYLENIFILKELINCDDFLAYEEPKPEKKIYWHKYLKSNGTWFVIREIYSTKTFDELFGGDDACIPDEVNRDVREYLLTKNAIIANQILKKENSNE